MQTALGGNGSCFVYFDGAGLHGSFAPSGNQGRPDILGPVRTVAARAVPPRDASAATPRRSAGRATLSWQHFEDPPGHGAVQFTRVAWLGIGNHIHI